MQATNNNGNGNATTRKSYVFASMANNATIEKAKAFASDTSKTHPRASIELMKAVALLDNATTTTEAQAAAKAANRAMNAYETPYEAVIDLQNLALTIAGVFGYIDASVNLWVSFHAEIEKAEWTRKRTAKTTSFQFVVYTTDGHKMFVTLNNSAALDWRKLDAKVNDRLAKWAAKAETDKAKAIAREKKAAARKAASAAKTQQRKIELAQKRLAAAQAQLDLLMKAA